MVTAKRKENSKEKKKPKERNLVQGLNWRESVEKKREEGEAWELRHIPVLVLSFLPLLPVVCFLFTFSVSFLSPALECGT